MPARDPSPVACLLFMALLAGAWAYWLARTGADVALKRWKRKHLPPAIGMRDVKEAQYHD